MPTDLTVSSVEPSANAEVKQTSVESKPVGERSDKAKANNMEVSEPNPKGKTKARNKKSQVLRPNRVRQCRIESMMSKAELARRANLSVLTIDRLEKGFGCRMHTKRKILEALGLSLADRVRVFGEEEE